MSADRRGDGVDDEALELLRADLLGGVVEALGLGPVAPRSSARPLTKDRGAVLGAASAGIPLTASAAIGAPLLLASDVLAQRVLAPLQLPVGLVTGRSAPCDGPGARPRIAPLRAVEDVVGP